MDRKDLGGKNGAERSKTSPSTAQNAAKNSDYIGSVDFEGRLAASICRTFNCPRCRTQISVSKKDVGTTVVCPDCDSELVVPDYLDFSPTAEERRRAVRSTPEKKRRDELLSPIQNPNRIGVDLEKGGLYGVLEDGAENRFSEQEWFPVICSICKAIMYATRENLGASIRCPDCGTETIATSAVRERLDAAAKLSPFPPAPPKPKEKKSAKPIKTFADAAAKRKKSGFSAAPRLSPVRRAGVVPDENLPYVLRRRGDGFVWALGSPPEKAPLFNGAFRTLTSVEVWARALLLAGQFLPIVVILTYLALDAPVETKTSPMERCVFGLAGTSTFILGTFAIISWAQHFAAVFSAGNLGARRVPEWFDGAWSGGGFWNFIGTLLDERGLWGLKFALILLASASCGIGLSFAAEALEVGGAASGGVSWDVAVATAASICVFFPIFFLSTVQTDYFFAPICRAVVESWRRRPGVWAQFYLTTALFVGVPTAFFLRFCASHFVLYCAAFALPVVSTLYALLIGRISWILDDDIRRDEAEAEGWEY